MKKIIIALAIVIIPLIAYNIFYKKSETVEPELIIKACVKRGDDYLVDKLSVGETEVMRIGTAPNGAVNLCFHFEYDGGVIRVASPDEDVQLSVSTSGGVVRMVAGENVRFGFSVPVPGTGAYVSAFPLGSARGDCVIPDNEAGARFTEVEGYEGRSYRLQVTAYNMDDMDSPAATAILRLVQGPAGTWDYTLELSE